MAGWLNSYNRDCSLESFSRELFVCRYAGSGKYKVVDSIVKALKSGLAVGAVVAALAAAGYSGPQWKNLVNRLYGQVSTGNQDARNIQSIADEELGWGSLPVPLGRQTPVTPDVDEDTDVDDADSDSMFNYISGHEGRGLVPGMVYEDGSGNPTIGVGHLMGNRRSRDLFARLFGNSVDYDAVLSGRRGLTRDQEIELFNADVQDKLATARRLIRRFDGLRAQTRNAIVDALYRGDLGPNTIRLMNAGDWAAAAVEYLNHGEYRRTRNALDRGQRTENPGIAERMESNSRIFSEQGR
jgi:GH24 family phage-related lysozyme (muramidase)